MVSAWYRGANSRRSGLCFLWQQLGTIICSFGRNGTPNATGAAKRRAEERMSRWDAAKRRSEPPPAYLQLERVHKLKVKELQPRRRSS